MLEQRQSFAPFEETQELVGELEPFSAPAVAPQAPGRPEGFQLPSAIWKAMFACYALFITALAVATGGDGHARMAIAIAVLFMLVYFSTAAILGALGGPDSNFVDRGRPLQTIYGPLEAREVWAQVLIVPVALALFGLGILAASSLAGA